MNEDNEALNEIARMVQNAADAEYSPREFHIPLSIRYAVARQVLIREKRLIEQVLRGLPDFQRKC